MHFMPQNTPTKRICYTSMDGSRNPKRAKIDWISTADEVSPCENDIIFFGNPKMTCFHPGNQAFADAVNRYAEKYYPSEDMLMIAERIVHALSSHFPPIRFLFRTKIARHWSILSTSDSILVTNQALLVAGSKLEQKEACATVTSEPYDILVHQNQRHPLGCYDPTQQSHCSSNIVPSATYNWRVHQHAFHPEPVDRLQTQLTTLSEDIHDVDIFQSRLHLPTALDEAPLPLNFGSTSQHAASISDNCDIDPLPNTSDRCEGSLETWTRREFNSMLTALDCEDSFVAIS